MSRLFRLFMRWVKEKIRVMDHQKLDNRLAVTMFIVFG